MTVAEIKAKIAELVAAINNLQAQLIQLQPVSEIPIPVGYQFKAIMRLKYGQRSDDVKKLQIFLKAQGSEIYPEGLVTGYFGTATKAAVKKFQLRYKTEILAPYGLTVATGVVGEKTLIKINNLLGK